MKALSKLMLRSSLFGLSIGGFLFVYANTQQAISFLTGYFLFTVNIWAISYLSAQMVGSMKQQDEAFQHKRRRWKAVGFFIAGAKFFGLMIGLYLALVYFNLPPIAFTAGALSSLMILTWNFATAYLKNGIAVSR